jgi:hypothetical protein
MKTAIVKRLEKQREENLEDLRNAVKELKTSPVSDYEANKLAGVITNTYDNIQELDRQLDLIATAFAQQEKGIS